MTARSEIVGAWEHRGARRGFEVAFLRATAHGWELRGAANAVEDGEIWSVGYRVELDAAWRTRRAEVAGRSAGGDRRVTLEAGGDGTWRVDGVAAPALDGCADVALEASVVTNAFPVRRLGLAVGAAADAPAAYVRAADLAVERLEQRYARVDDADGRSRYDYRAPAFAFVARLTYDADGLVADYPGIGVRVARR